MSFLWEPFASEFMLRALIGGVLVAVLCAVTGTWVVVRGMAFLGEAMAHGMLPGVATAMLRGLPGPVGGIVAAGGMAAGITVVQRRTRTSQDTPCVSPRPPPPSRSWTPPIATTHRRAWMP